LAEILEKNQNRFICAEAHTQNGVNQRHGCRCSHFERVVQDALTRKVYCLIVRSGVIERNKFIACY